MYRCYICQDQDQDVPAVAFCTELNKPVCQKHADGCREDGHEAISLDKGVTKRAK